MTRQRTSGRTTRRPPSMAIYRGTFLQHGLQLDYAAGKSDCLIAMSGADAKKIREKTFLGESCIARGGT